MSQPLPGPFFLGRNVNVFGVATNTIDVTGSTITAGTPTSFLGKFDSIEFEAVATTVEIHAANATIENNLITTDGFTVRITEIIPANGNSLLLANYLAADYFTATWQAAPNAGIGTAGKLMTVTGIRKSITTEVREGKSVAVLTLLCAGNAPTFA